MTKPGEHKTAQARILAYPEAIGWSVASRQKAEQRRGFDLAGAPYDRAKTISLFFDDLLNSRIGRIRTLRGQVGAQFIDILHLHVPRRGIQR